MGRAALSQPKPLQVSLRLVVSADGIIDCSRQLADAELAEVDVRALAFEAEIALGRIAAGAAGDFLAD